MPRGPAHLGCLCLRRLPITAPELLVPVLHDNGLAPRGDLAKDEAFTNNDVRKILQVATCLHEVIALAVVVEVRVSKLQRIEQRGGGCQPHIIVLLVFLHAL